MAQFHPYFAQKMPDLVRLLKAHKVVSAYAFGSVLTNSFNEESDIDLLIKFEENLDPVENGELWWSLWYALQELYGRKVDLVIERSVRNPYFKAELAEKRELIYA